MIDQINYNKELFEYLKKIFPDAKAVPKRKYYQTSQPNRKLKASVIICPDCNYHCVEDRDSLIDHFLRHVKKVHHITPTAQFVEILQAKINYLRNNGRISYIDPFVHVQWEDLF